MYLGNVIGKKTFFAAGVYQSFELEIHRHVGIFDPALRTVAPLTFSPVQLSHLPRE
jgi:hypothetical protein